MQRVPAVRLHGAEWRGAREAGYPGRGRVLGAQEPLIRVSGPSLGGLVVRVVDGVYVGLFVDGERGWFLVCLEGKEEEKGSCMSSADNTNL